MNDGMQLTVRTADGCTLAARRFGEASAPAVVIAAAMAVPQRHYRHLAGYLAENGFCAWTFDYRGIAESPAQLDATISDWALRDLPAIVDRVHEDSGAVHLIGHSLGGQIAGLLPRPERIASLVSVVGQSGHWRYQGGLQPPVVALLGYVVLPLLARMFRTFPFQTLRFGVDAPAAAVRQWASWVRHPDYLFGDEDLPTERYREFAAPVLAYSIDDDNWGTAAAVDKMMLRYPRVERRHLVPANYGMRSIGHVGAFRPEARQVWDEIRAWLQNPG